MKEHTLTSGSISKGLLYFVLPIIAGSLVQQLYVTVDAIVVGQFTGQPVPWLCCWVSSAPLAVCF